MYEITLFVSECLIGYSCCVVTAATNKQHSSSKDTAKLDRETEELRREYT